MPFPIDRSSTRARGPLAVLLLGFCASLLVPGAALADRANPDTTFIETQRASVLDHLDGILASVMTPSQALESVSLLLLDRRGANAELGSRLSPTSLDGIETQDEVDRIFLSAIHAVSHAGVQADTAASPVELALRFGEHLGEIPGMGASPLPFMLLSLAELAVATADSMRRTPDFPETEAAKLALRLIHTATHDQVESSGNIVERARTEQFRHKSVLVRMRCPKDGAPYRTIDMKTKIHGNGDVATIYFLNCTVCGEAVTVDYVGEVASKLNRIADRQKIRGKPRPTPPPRRLDP